MATPDCILLTGAAGYIASHTWLALQEAGYTVVGVDSFVNSSPVALDRLREIGGQPIHFVQGDVRDPAVLDRCFELGQTLGGIKAVVHFAALKAVGESVERPLDYFENNLGSLLAVSQAMQRHGVNIELKGFTDERVASEEYRTGQCAGFVATAFRTRQFNPTAGSIDTLGATTIVRDGKIDINGSYDVVRKLVQTFATPAANRFMVNGQHEVGGIIPLGAAYPVVNDRKINSVEALAGKRIASFDHDKAQAVMIQRIGAQPVSADITNFATMFNNGSVDVIIAPAIIYRPFELQKGIGTKGGVARFPITILSYQMIIRSSAFPEGFGQVSRSHFAKNVEEAIRIARKADLDIPPKLWLDPTQEENDQYMVLMRQGRVLMANKGLFDKTGLKILKRIRCSVEPASAECSERTEEWK